MLSMVTISSTKDTIDSPESQLAIVDFEDLQQLNQTALSVLSSAFVGNDAFGVVGVRGVPGYGEARREAFKLAAHLAVHDKEAQERCAGVRQTYPGGLILAL